MTNNLLNPINIGGLSIQTPLFLAPMAGQTNHALRTLTREQGDCGMVCTELLSSVAMQYKSERTFNMFDWTTDEIPFAVQLFGADPAMMADAAQLVEEHGAPIVDINMGCWVPKVAKTGAGAALLRDICTATAVVKAIVDAVKVPVTVKIRAGWDQQTMTGVSFAQAARDSGVAAIAVHARTAKQGFSGEADWNVIRQVKELVTDIPIIGNGDVKDAATCEQMLRETGCDGVMIGRAAMGKPWLFREIAHEIRTGEKPEPLSVREMAQIALRHAQVTIATTKFPIRQAILELRGQLTQYKFGIPGSAMMRDRLVRAESLAEIEDIFNEVIERYSDPIPA